MSATQLETHVDETKSESEMILASTFLFLRLSLLHKIILPRLRLLLGISPFSQTCDFKPPFFVSYRPPSSSATTSATTTSFFLRDNLLRDQPPSVKDDEHKENLDWNELQRGCSKLQMELFMSTEMHKERGCSLLQVELSVSTAHTTENGTVGVPLIAQINLNHTIKNRCTFKLAIKRSNRILHNKVVPVQVIEVPMSYIMDRWRKDIKRGYQSISNIYDDYGCGGKRLRYNTLTPLMQEVQQLGGESDEISSVLVEIMKDTKEKLIIAMENGQSRAEQLEKASASGAKVIHSPLKVRTKGRLPTKRKQSKVEQIVNKSLAKARKKTIYLKLQLLKFLIWKNMEFCYVASSKVEMDFWKNMELLLALSNCY
ncbi:hypothetical protein ZIOFF_070504 [Zingiber officinale]|uniref:Uncharacterized protein n=1 Tax=Zingiber officinale TaxID=94328 RepID=A0A8J5EN27_ZINOF|nr:hypothetical protein ZIOFF_070504 [Zingiber officinale]